MANIKPVHTRYFVILKERVLYGPPEGGRSNERSSAHLGEMDAELVGRLAVYFSLAGFISA